MRRICRKCGYGFYWPPLGDPNRTRNQNLCLSCDRSGNGEPDEDEANNNCTVEDMLEIST